MRYTVTARQGDGHIYRSTVDTTAGDNQAVELARNLVESYGHTLVGVQDADGKEIPVGNEADDQMTRGDDKQHKDTEERVEEQDQTTTERVDTQKVETKEVTPDKTGDVKPNR